jgi:hypothetical protein
MGEQQQHPRHYLPLNVQWNGKKEDWHTFTVVLSRKIHLKEWTAKSPWDARTFNQEYLETGNDDARPARLYQMDANNASEYMYDSDGETMLTDASATAQKEWWRKWRRSEMYMYNDLCDSILTGTKAADVAASIDYVNIDWPGTLLMKKLAEYVDGHSEVLSLDNFFQFFDLRYSIEHGSVPDFFIELEKKHHRVRST